MLCSMSVAGRPLPQAKAAAGTWPCSSPSSAFSRARDFDPERSMLLATQTLRQVAWYRQLCVCAPEGTCLTSRSLSMAYRTLLRSLNWSTLWNLGRNWMFSRLDYCRVGASFFCFRAHPSASSVLCTGDEARVPEAELYHSASSQTAKNAARAGWIHLPGTWRSLPASSSCSSRDPCYNVCEIRPSMRRAHCVTAVVEQSRSAMLCSHSWKNKNASRTRKNDSDVTIHEDAKCRDQSLQFVLSQN